MNNDGFEDGSCVAGAIGRVPWKTLGIPEPKDGAGATLWYAIAGPFRNYNMNSASISSDTLGNLTLYLGSSATTLTSQAIAVIFVPGASLGAQNRDPSATALCATTGTTIARNLCAANYLEATGGGNNAQTGGPFIQAQSSGTFNDRLLVITNADLMPVVEQRVAREMLRILQDYKTATGVYPWADRSDGNSDGDEGVQAWNHSRFPCNDALPTNWGSGGTPDLPNWLEHDCLNPVTGWTSVIFYAVARNRLQNSGTGCTNCSASTLTVTNSTNGIADLCLTGVIPFGCTPTVVSSGPADLILITPGAATVNPRGNWPNSSFGAITGYFEDAENSDNNNDNYVVPSSTNYDRDRIYLVR